MTSNRTRSEYNKLASLSVDFFFLFWHRGSDDDLEQGGLKFGKKLAWNGKPL